MSDQDYQLEELENAAVNKSNTAKRIAAATGLVGVGAAGGYAATFIPGQGDSENNEETVDETEATENADNPLEEAPVAKPQTHHQPQPKPEPVTEEKVDISFDKTTQYYANDELIVTQEEGMIDGRNFKLIDVDGDMRADFLAYDQDGNGIYNDDEIVELHGSDQIAMGHDSKETETIKIYGYNGPMADNNYDSQDFNLNEEKDFADNGIHNDFDDEKTGESYSHDYAQNNENYNNNADIDHFSAGYHEPDMALDDTEESLEEEFNGIDMLAETADDDLKEDFNNEDFEII